MKPFAFSGSTPVEEVPQPEGISNQPEIIYDPLKQLHVIKTKKGYEEAIRHPSVITSTMQTPTYSSGSLDDEDPPADGPS